MKPDGDKKPDGGTDPDEGKKPAGTPKPDKKPAKDDGSGEKNGGSDDGSGRRTGQDDAGGSGGEDADGQGPGAGDGNGNVNPGAGGNGDAAGGDQFSAGNNAIGTDSESESGMPVPEEPGPDQALAEKLESQTGNLFYDLIKGNLPFGRLDQRGAWGLLNLILSLLAFGTAAVVALRMFLRGIVIPEITYPRGLYWRFSGGETGEDPPAIHPRLRWLFCASGLLPFLLWIFLDRLNEPVVWINHNTIVIAILTAIQTAALTLYQRRLRLATGNTEKGQRAVEG